MKTPTPFRSVFTLALCSSIRNSGNVIYTIALGDSLSPGSRLDPS